MGYLFGVPETIPVLSKLRTAKESFNEIMDLERALNVLGYSLKVQHYDDQQVQVSGIRLPSSGAPSWVTYRGSSVLAFSASQDNTVHFNVQFTHARKLQEVVDLHNHVIHPDSNAGDVLWQYTYSWAGIDQVFPTETTGTQLHTAPGVADQHSVNDLIAITPPSTDTLSAFVLCSLTRLGTDASDTYGSDIYLPGLDFHILKDGLGSREETSK